MGQATLEEIRERADIRPERGKPRTGAGFRTCKEQGE